MTTPATLLAHIRSGAFFDRDRVRAYSAIFLVLQLAAVLFIALGQRGYIIPFEQPTTTDFSSFYAAGLLADEGTPALAWDQAAHADAQRRVYGDPRVNINHFFYPPPLLLICAPLARLPYLPAFYLFEIAQALLYMAALRAILGRGATLLPYVAFPAAVIAFAIGQNALLTASLFAAATLMIARQRPVLAGLALGALCYKPHFGLLVPVALMAGGHWRAVAAAAVAVAGLCLAATLAFGPEIWPAYLHTFTTRAVTTFETGGIPPSGLISPFAAVLVAGGGPGPAYAVQGVVTLAAAGLVAWLWRTCAEPAPRAIALVAGTMVSIPVILIYDFLPAAVGLAWLARDARATGWLDWEKAFIAAAFAIALVSRPLAMAFHLPLGPAVGVGLLILAWRRARLPRRSPQMGMAAPAAAT
jgi:hypothetical protein